MDPKAELRKILDVTASPSTLFEAAQSPPSRCEALLAEQINRLARVVEAIAENRIVAQEAATRSIGEILGGPPPASAAERNRLADEAIAEIKRMVRE